MDSDNERNFALSKFVYDTEVRIMGKQSKKIKNKYRLENVNNKYIAVKPADAKEMLGENDIEIPSFTVDGEFWVRATDIIKGLGKKAIARGAVGLLDSVGMKKNKDYYISAVMGQSGVSAVMKLDTAIKFLEKLNAPLMKPEYYDYVSVTMKNELRQMMEDFPVDVNESYTLKNNRLVSMSDGERKNAPSCGERKIAQPGEQPNRKSYEVPKEIMDKIANGMKSESDALIAIAESLKEIKNDRADMAAMIDYLGRDIRDMKRTIEKLCDMWETDNAN